MAVVLNSIAGIREALAGHLKEGNSVGFVPTMGALHEGHASLLDRARRENDAVVLGIFVNPTQFGPNEDYLKYPRPLEKDVEIARGCGVDFVFAPSVEEMYPAGFGTFVEPGEVAKPLCGNFRRGHFRGVATVVAKLFQIVKPSRAYFGQKDWQQTRVVSQLVRDLNFGVELVVCPIVRDSDGLALSSRNDYLSPEERRAALVLNRALSRAEELFSKGERKVATLRKALVETIESEPLAKVQYAEILDSETLEEIDHVAPGKRAVAALAVFVGKTRLIDNIILGPA